MSYKPKSAGRDIKQGEEQWQQSHEESYELLSLDKTGLKHAYVNIYTLKSVMQGQCIDRPAVTFPAVGNLPLDRYKIILLGDMYMNNLPEVVTQKWNSHELNRSLLEWQVQCPNHHTTRPHQTGYAVKNEKKYLMERTQPSRGWASQTVNGRNISRLSVGTISLSSTHTCCMHITYTQLHVSYTKWCHNGVAYGEDLQCMGRNNMERSKESCQWSPYLLMMQ